MGIRTDLAIEAREFYSKQEDKKDIPGVEVDMDKGENYTVTRVKVVEDVGARIMGKPKGNYITIEVPKLRENDKDLQDEAGKVLAGEVERLVNLSDQSVIMVVGLGNWNVTPDALGPRVVEHLLVTRHIKEYVPDQIDEGVRSVCAIAPGVLGITGIETSEIIRGIVDKVKPDIVIAIDALSSRKMERISTTIQLADTGINPGSGVGNNRKELSRQSMGVPVIAIGVPTVVDAATMANDTIDMVIDTLISESPKSGEFYNMLKNMDKTEKYRLINEVISPYIGNLMVTPKEIDRLIDDMAIVIANGLNIALHPSINHEDMERYLN
ncbi:MAG: GPR endopeptidase [Gracilibacteraceae bacterium]|nr:GPR endopeptidase [Gracilibacteraceae bacterium]